MDQVINQRVAILVDGNNIEYSVLDRFGRDFVLDYSKFVPKVVGSRSLTKFCYFREGRSISAKFAAHIRKLFYGAVFPCGKSADIPLTIQAVQLAPKIDTVIVFSGDSDYLALYEHLKTNGVRVEVACSKGSVSQLVLDFVDAYWWIEAEDIRDLRSIAA